MLAGTLGRAILYLFLLLAKVFKIIIGHQRRPFIKMISMYVIFLFFTRQVGEVFSSSWLSNGAVRPAANSICTQNGGQYLGLIQIVLLRMAKKLG